MRKAIYGIVAVAMLVLAACGGSKAEPTAVPSAASAQQAIAQVLEVTANDLYYNVADNVANPQVWNVTAGQPFEINLQNKGGLQHNWAIVKQGSVVPIPFDSVKNADLLLWDAGLVEPGATEKGQFTVTEPGTYQIICTVAGHYPSMQGKLVVK